MEIRPRALRCLPIPVSAGFVFCVAAALTLAGGGQANAGTTAVQLGTAQAFGVLAGSTVTNTGATTITGSVGVSPGTAIVGFPPGLFSGARHAGGSVASIAQDDLTTAYNTAAAATPRNEKPVELGGKTLLPGVYHNGTFGVTGTLTLNGGNDPNAVFIFQADSTLITASASRVALIGVNPCNVYWKVGSSATFGTGSTFVGNVLALTAITANNGASFNGRLLARNAAVTLDNNTIIQSACRVTNPIAGSSAPGGGTSSTPGGGTTSTPAAGKTTSKAGGSGRPLRATPTTTNTSRVGATTNGPPVTARTGPSTPGQPPVLASTGANPIGLLGGGLLAIVVGAGILFLGRRAATAGRQH